MVTFNGRLRVADGFSRQTVDQLLHRQWCCRKRVFLKPFFCSKNASAGNRTRVTSMATMYSTTRPLMQVTIGFNSYYFNSMAYFPSGRATHHKCKVCVKRGTFANDTGDSNPCGHVCLCVVWVARPMANCVRQWGVQSERWINK